VQSSPLRCAEWKINNTLDDIAVSGVMTAAPTASDGSWLISTEKPATQSSTKYGGEPGLATDGNTDGDWMGKSVTCTKEEERPWWKVDLLGGFEVKKVVVYNRVDCCGDRLNGFDVLVDDEKCGSVAVASEINTVFCSDKLGKTVQVQLQKKGTLALAEVQVYGFRVVAPVKKPADCKAPATPLDLKGMSPTQSSDIGGNPKRAVDGNTNGQWGGGSCTHTNADNQAWWQIDLGKEYEIAKVVIFNRADCCADRNNNLQIRVDDKLAATILTAQVPSNSVDLKCVRGQIVKIQEPTAMYLTLCEVQIFAEPFDAVAFIKNEKKKASSFREARRMCGYGPAVARR
jgi:hypothetical protein